MLAGRTIRSKTIWFLLAGTIGAVLFAAARTQKSDFLQPNGAVFDVCAGKPCHTSVYTP